MNLIKMQSAKLMIRGFPNSPNKISRSMFGIRIEPIYYTPSTAFDEFRDPDFERRKAESFPSPLFKCSILTPETTTEQQLV
jgi:hypothetical protein